MVFVIIIAFFSLIGLLVLHEFGHFILAKKFGVRVEEFGIGYPPRLLGKKVGETLYSLNLLPFGAFVRLFGEEKQTEEPRSFFSKPIWQRGLIVLGGVFSFWLIGAVLLSFVMAVGVPTAIDDDANQGLVGPRVQIAAVSRNSPAQEAGLKVGDTIREFSILNSQFSIDKVKQVQEITEKYAGQEITLIIERGKEIFNVQLVPRENPPEGEGAMGVALVRTAIMSYPWYLAFLKGIEATANLTVMIIKGWGRALFNVFAGKPTAVQLMGPVGIFGMFAQVGQLGINYFLQFIAIIALNLALINLAPIPAVDGGKLLFLVIEKIRKRPIAEKVEKMITGFFFALIIVLMLWVTIKDVFRLFSG